MISFGGAFALYNYVKSNIETASYVSEALKLVKASPDAMLALEGQCDVQNIKLFGETRTRLRANEAQASLYAYHTAILMVGCCLLPNPNMARLPSQCMAGMRLKAQSSSKHSEPARQMSQLQHAQWPPSILTTSVCCSWKVTATRLDIDWPTTQTIHVKEQSTA